MAIRGRRCRPVDTRRSSSQLKGSGSADRPFHQLARVLIFSDSSTVHCTLFAIIVTSALCAICLRSSVSDFGSNSTQIVPSCWHASGVLSKQKTPIHPLKRSEGCEGKIQRSSAIPKRRTRQIDAFSSSATMLAFNADRDASPFRGLRAGL
jgi:hypothetical protein